MVILLALVNGLLSTLARISAWRSNANERKYTDAYMAAQAAVAEAEKRPGNAAKPDALTAARQNMKLIKAAQVADRYEGKWGRWEARKDRLRRVRARVAGWKGFWGPFALGGVDVAAALTALGVVDWSKAADLARSLLSAAGVISA